MVKAHYPGIIQGVERMSSEPGYERLLHVLQVTSAYAGCDLKRTSGSYTRLAMVGFFGTVHACAT